VAKKKRRRRPSGAGSPAAGSGERATGTQTRERGVSETAAVRRERKEEARQARQAALRRYQRQRMVRRGLTWGAAALALLLVVYFFQHRGASGTGALSKQATNTATAAGCTGLQKPPDQGRSHTTNPVNYRQQPPTSGPHNPIPLGAGVYSTPQPEVNLVHSLEHGAVEFYYEASGPNALPADVVSALKSVANGNSRVIMTPAPQTLSAPLDGKTFTPSLAFAAWDRLIQCPGTITADQGKTLAKGWVDAFVNADNAPEKGFPL
jgi:Protein of unknown function (DUF3105)